MIKTKLFWGILTVLLFLILGCKKNSTALEDHFPEGVVTDINGNKYRTVQIGTQCWMAENLKVTRYQNGDTIPNITDSFTWIIANGAYCNYNNDTDLAESYGRLYNWYAVADTRDIAPVGWHVPTDSDWEILISHLGGSSLAGGKMKETGTTHWSTTNNGASNESGFAGLPGGLRNKNGDFSGIASRAFFWSSTEYFEGNAWYRILYGASSECDRNYIDKYNGFSVRCIKD